MEEKKASELRLTVANFFLMAGGVSVEDRSKRVETVGPHHYKHYERQIVCDSVLSVKNDGDDIGLKGEADDEGMEDGETGFDDGSAQVRNIRDPGQQTVKEQQEHMATHRPHRSWCKFCVMGRGVNSPHRRSDAEDDFEGVHHVSMDCGFLGEKGSEEQVTPLLVICERRHRNDVGFAGSKKRNGVPLGSQRERRSLLISLGTTELRSDVTKNQRLRRWQGISHKLVKKEVRLCQRDRQWEKVSLTESSNARWDLWLARPER